MSHCLLLRLGVLGLIGLLILPLRASEFVEAYGIKVRGLGAIALQCEDGSSRTIGVSLANGPAGPGTQGDEHAVVSYAKRVKLVKRNQRDKLPPVDYYSNCVVNVECKELGIGQTYHLLPHFNMSKGLYDHKDVVASMPKWRKMYALAPDRVYDYLFVPDEAEGATLFFLDGSLAKKIDGVLKVVGAKVVEGGRRKARFVPEIVSQGILRIRHQRGMYEIPPLANRAHPLLVSGARLSIDSGARIVGGVPMTVWKPEESIDQGQHRQTTGNRDLVWNPMNERTAWSSGPEYFNWSVPAKTWLFAHVLCADLPEEGKEPVVGTHLAKFGRGCTAGNIDFETVSLKDPAAKGLVRKVGELSYVKGGKPVTTPLYLVTLRLECGTLGKRGIGQESLDFEFVGAGRQERYPRSSVQVFGCTLEEAPYSFLIDNPVRGNIFEQGSDRQVSAFDVIANRDNLKGRVEIDIYDPLFRPLKTIRREFAISSAGERRRVELDLSEFGIGWYGMDMTFRTDGGDVVATHEAAFTVLHADDREAGYESPYAAWPLLGGYHGANTNRFEQLDVMRKAGYRTTWHPPCTNEAEGAKWKVTKSAVGMRYFNPGPPAKTPEEVKARLDAAVEDMRADFAAYPHCRFIQLLHETGGKTVSEEVMNGVKGIVGEYRGWCNDWMAEENKNAWLAYYCTEFAKRMRREFPDKRIFVGNGSSACERIASLCRAGFDLKLVHELGIESKGFSTMPEFNANQEAPGMLWALRETGRAFGYSHLGLNACNEYVFRPERQVSRTWTERRIMQVTDFSLRDYLLSLAHGCSIISTGHLEDCNDSYYETNWGAGGQCKFYPYSYPKRVFTALAVLTRVLDRVSYSRRVPTGEITSYALEFRRNRKVKDYAYALWTPHFGATLGLTFPGGTVATLVSAFGVERKLRFGVNGEVRVEIGSTPTYIVASTPVSSARVIGHRDDVPDGLREVARVNAGNVRIVEKDLGGYGNGWGVPPPLPGRFELTDVVDAEHGQVLELRLVRDGTVPAIRWESVSLLLDEPIRFSPKTTAQLGLWVRGNGAFQMLQLLVRGKGGRGPVKRIAPGPGALRGYVAFDGWQFLSFDTLMDGRGRKIKWKADDLEVYGIVSGSARQALDPIEMAEVTREIAIGPFASVVRSEPVANDVEAVSKDEANDAMKTVDEKDL